jgi:guanylate kinase
LARIEMAAAPEFDHILVNNEVNQVIEKMVALVSAFRD